MVNKTSSSSNKGNKPDSFQLNELVIFSHDNTKAVDISNHWVTFTLQEDLFSNSIIGMITIIDDSDLYNSFPFVGEEYIFIDFSVPILRNGNSSLTLFVNSMTTPVLDPTNKRKTYTFSLTSPDALVSSSKLVNRATHNQPASDTVKDIMSSEIKTSKEVIVSSKSAKLNYLLPGWHPFDCIKFIRRKVFSVDENDKSPWVFFERFDNKFIFDSLKGIIQTGFDNYDEKKHKLSKAIISSDNIDIIDHYRIIRRINFESNLNKLGSLAEGGLSSQTFEIDLLAKKVNKYKFNYDDGFKNLVPDKMSSYKEFSDRFIKNNSQDIAVNFGLFSDFVYKSESNKNHKIGVQLGEKQIFMNSLVSQSTIIEVAGNNNWHVGDVVYLNLLEATGVEKKVYKEDIRQAGYYCIEGVKHRFDRKKMSTTLKLFSIGSKFNINEIVAKNDNKK